MNKEENRYLRIQGMFKKRSYFSEPIFLLLLIFSFSGFSQNLVLNGGFEEVKHCPKRFNNGKSLNSLAHGWSYPTRGTPDIFNICNTSNLGVENLCGVTRPRSGNGFAGLILWDKDGIREYLQTKLAEPLKKGETYKVEFYYKYASYSMYETNKICIGFPRDSVFRDDFYRFTVNVNYYKIQKLNFNGDSRTWFKVELEYVAKGGEQYLVMGNFLRDEQIKSTHWETKKIQQLMLLHSAYYYLDDISVERIVPEISNDLETVELTDTVTLKNVTFDFNKSTLKRSSFLELDKVAEIMEKHPDWKVKINGHTDATGKDEYNLNLSRRRAQRVGSYLVSKGISKSRISPKGYGSQYPSKANTDQENRRVEVEFYLEE